MIKFTSALFTSMCLLGTPALSQETESISDEALVRLANMNVEIVQISENGDIIRAADDGWIEDGDTYPLLNKEYILITDGDTIDKGSCKNALGCSTNKYTGSVTLSTPPKWVFSKDSIAISQKGWGANGDGVNGDPITRTVPLKGAIVGVDEIKVGHYCHRAGGYAKGGCQSTLSVTALAIQAK